MSRIEGIQELIRKLETFEQEVAVAMNDAVLAEAKAMQDEVVSLVPVDEGDGRDALADEEALRIVKSPDGPGIRVIYGLDVPRLAKKAFHLFWVEFGTKGYAKGERRKAGKKKLKMTWRFVSTKNHVRDPERFNYRETVNPKTGKVRLEQQLLDPQRWEKMNRRVPARPAQPFWRPAEANLWRRLQRRLDVTRIVVAAKRAAGLADRS